eukprot:TRINITY_DN121216_c0_g1_i1.p1 TRINITY_DN121216_c0_g1~~TRINITY_DN121216_c0_g1_i1.p1  ORF type:complete len:893 (+),score=278.90 TRINITY_DN121216_c0_g1_i1:156-2834(+)
MLTYVRAAYFLTLCLGGLRVRGRLLSAGDEEASHLEHHAAHAATRPSAFSDLAGARGLQRVAARLGAEEDAAPAAAATAAAAASPSSKPSVQGRRTAPVQRLATGAAQQGGAHRAAPAQGKVADHKAEELQEPAANRSSSATTAAPSRNSTTGTEMTSGAASATPAAGATANDNRSSVNNSSSLAAIATQVVGDAGGASGSSNGEFSEVKVASSLLQSDSGSSGSTKDLAKTGQADWVPSASSVIAASLAGSEPWQLPVTFDHSLEKVVRDAGATKVNATTLRTLHGTRADKDQLAEMRKNWLFMTLAFVAGAVVQFVYFVLLAGGSVEQALMDRAEELATLQSSYETMMKDFEKKMKGLCDMQVDWSQHVLNGKKEDFIEFLNRVQNFPEKLGGAQADALLLVPFQKLLKLWLKTFSECSIDPVKEPLLVAEADSIIDDAKSLGDICTKLVQALEPMKIQFMEVPEEERNKRGSVWQVDATIKADKTKRQDLIEAAKKPQEASGCSWLDIVGLNKDYKETPKPLGDRQAAETFPLTIKPFGCCGCSLGGKLVRINLISAKHTAFVLYATVMHLLLLMNYLLQSPLAAFLSMAGCVLMIILLVRFEKSDVLAQMEISQNLMTEQKNEMIQKARKLDNLYSKVADPANVWINRTRPKLDIFSGLYKKLTGTKWQSVDLSKEFLEAVVQGLEQLEKSFGSLHLWIPVAGGEYETLLNGEAMKIMRQLAEKASKGIKTGNARELKTGLVEMLKVPKLMTVRVKQCRNLPRGMLSDDYDPYVRIRAREEGKWLKTNSLGNNPNPDWTGADQADMRFMIRQPDAVLEVEIMDENVLGSDTYIGGCKLPVAQLQAEGRWRTITKSLEDASQGEVELDAFYSPDAASLAKLMPRPRVTS